MYAVYEIQVGSKVKRDYKVASYSIYIVAMSAKKALEAALERLERSDMKESEMVTGIILSQRVDEVVV